MLLQCLPRSKQSAHMCKAGCSAEPPLILSTQLLGACVEISAYRHIKNTTGGLIGRPPSRDHASMTRTHHMPWRWLTSLSGCSGSTAQELVVPTVAITKLGVSPACTGRCPKSVSRGDPLVLCEKGCTSMHLHNLLHWFPETVGPQSQVGLAFTHLQIFLGRRLQGLWRQRPLVLSCCRQHAAVRDAGDHARLAEAGVRLQRHAEQSLLLDFPIETREPKMHQENTSLFNLAGSCACCGSVSANLVGGVDHQLGHVRRQAALQRPRPRSQQRHHHRLTGGA
jgi:hypothetical protein